MSTKPERFDPYTDPCECSWTLHDENMEGPAFCAKPETIAVVADFLKIDETNPEEIIDAAKEKLQCDSEKCVLETISKELPANKQKIVETDLDTRFKMIGPDDTTALFNNYHIDKTLSAWEKLNSEFKHIPFQFIDFREKNTILETLDVVRLYKNGVRMIGCVLNTDYSTGPGKHWICMFIDMRNSDEFSIEFFNSSGRPPIYNNNAIMNWMCEIKRDIESFGKIAVIKTNSIVHQQSNTECGPYCMYFLYNRIKNVPFERFSTQRIPDADVTEFREHLFT